MMILYTLFYFIQGSALRHHGNKVPRLSPEEAVELERQAHAADLERKRRIMERREKQGLLKVNGGALTREEQEARLWAFMYDDPFAHFITTNFDSDVCRLSGIINPPSLTSKMMTTTRRMKTRQRGSMMIKTTD